MSTPLGLQLWNGLAILLLSSLKKNPPKNRSRKSCYTWYSEVILALLKRKKNEDTCSLPRNTSPRPPLSFTGLHWLFLAFHGPCHSHNNAICREVICLLIFIIKRKVVTYSLKEMNKIFSKTAEVFRQAKE